MIISALTKKEIDNIDYESNQSILVYGDSGMYELEIAKLLSARFLLIKEDNLVKYPFFKLINKQNTTITIQQIRELRTYMNMTVPSDLPIARVVIINEVENMNVEAANALLKLLEETNSDSIIIMTTNNLKRILPTIRSRVRTLKLRSLKLAEISEQYPLLSTTEVEKNYLLSGGNLELLDEIINHTDTVLLEEIDIAKKIISSTKDEKIGLINELSKDKVKLVNIINLIKQMSIIGSRSSNTTQAKKWHKILQMTLNLQDKLQSNAQTKLCLLEYFISI